LLSEKVDDVRALAEAAPIVEVKDALSPKPVHTCSTQLTHQSRGIGLRCPEEPAHHGKPGHLDTPGTQSLARSVHTLAKTLHLHAADEAPVVFVRIDCAGRGWIALQVLTAA